jgi:hypothetical protein
VIDESDSDPDSDNYPDELDEAVQDAYHHADEAAEENNHGESGGEEDKESNPSTADEDDESVRDNEPKVTTRSGQMIKPQAKLTVVNHLHTQAHQDREEYLTEIAKIIAMVMC